jgi:nicotinamide-nucleotide amidase
MSSLARKTHRLLLRQNKTVATAESCTGGLLARVLTDLPGSSAYFLLGIVAYHNQAKIKLLKVPAQLIAKKGAVCAEACRKMAQQVRKISGADYGLGITGIAGPSGGTSAKPVGTVFIALASAGKCLCRKFIFRGSRASIRRQATLKAMQLLRKGLC